MFIKPPNGKPYIPPLGIPMATCFYDFWMEKILRWNSASVAKIIKGLKIKGDERILDIGCGTGSLLIDIKQRFPKTSLFGIDPDAEIINIAKEKAKKLFLNINFSIGYSQNLPFAPSYFDIVISSMAFHHLLLPDKKTSLYEIRRVLKKDGLFFLVDHWGKGGIREICFGLLGRFFDDEKTIADNKYLPILLKSTGFTFTEIRKERDRHFLACQSNFIVAH